MSIGLLGKKLGMTRVYNEAGHATAVTVIEAGENVLLQIKNQDSDGYNAVQLGFDTQKESRVTKAQLGHFKKANAAPKKLVKEFRLKDEETASADTEVGLKLFKQGDLVDVIGTSKGKGFTGVMKRHNFAGQEAAHGSKTHRRPGSIGNSASPGRVWKNQKMPGHYGDVRTTVQNLTVVQVREEDNVILISGAIPGAKGSYVMVRPAIKAKPKKEEAK